LKALLVDDERLARAGLRRMLRAHEDVCVIGEAANAEDATRKIRQLQPDVVFLDVEMPGKSGLWVLEDIDEAPTVIFTTAYPKYAVDAFDVSALDYLLKPITSERLASALDKVRKVALETKTLPNVGSQVFLRDGLSCWIMSMREITLMASDGNYTRVHFGGKSPLIRRSLNALERRLDPAVFFRASRSAIINLNEIKSLEERSDGGLDALLTHGIKVAISRRQARRLRDRLSL